MFGFGLGVLILRSALVAQAQDVPVVDEAAADEVEGEAREQLADELPQGDGPQTIERREEPDYDGRSPSPIRAGEVFAWIPRILLAPLYAAVEFGLRRPLGFMVSRAEEADALNKTIQFFHFGDRGQYALFPIFTVASARTSTIGLQFSATDVFADRNKFTTALSVGGFRRGVAIISASMSDRQLIGNWTLRLLGSFARREDGVFFGIGSDNRDSAIARYNYSRANVALELGHRIGEKASLTLTTGYRYQNFGSDIQSGTAPSLPEALANGTISELPSGFVESVSIHHTALNLVLDSRPLRPNPQSGVRLHARVAGDYDVRDPQRSAWLSYGGSLHGFVDVSGVNHVLSLVASVALIEEINGDVPFTELLSPGGNGALGGFVDGYLLATSRVALTFEYNWPIWYWLDGTIHFGVGNAFDGRLDGFALDQLRMSWGVGISAITARNHFFDFEFGWGTETFDNGANVESFRFVLGARRDF